MEIKIQGDDRCRIGGEYPYCLDVFKTDSGNAYGFSFYQFPPEIHGSLKIVELRYKEHSYALFMRECDDQKLPDWWKDSEIIWSSHTGN